MIHTLAEVPGARPLLAHNASREEGALELFEGGSLTDVVAAASAAVPPPAGARWGARGGGRSTTQNRQPRVHVYHGICAWSEGQLEGAPFFPLLSQFQGSVNLGFWCPMFLVTVAASSALAGLRR